MPAQSRFDPRPRLAALAASLLLVLGGGPVGADVGAPSTAPEPPILTAAAPAAVADIQGFAFPADIVIEAGSSVRWQNLDPSPHTVTAADGSFDPGTIQPSASHEIAFPTPGTFAYACLIHPSMTGTVTVQGGLGPATAPPAVGEPGIDQPSGTTSVVLERTTVFDTHPHGIGGPALTLLAPSGWNVEGGPVWRHEYSNLATFEGRVASPDLLRAVEFFPLFPQIWQDGGIPFFPVGSNYLGNDVRPPIRDAAAFLETLVLPAYRGAFEPRIIAREPLPDVVASYAASSLPGTEVTAERLLSEHFVDGRRMLEEFTVVLTFTPNPLVAGMVSWQPQQIFSIRAPEDEFAAARPVLQTIATSPVVELGWYAGYEYVLNLSIQNGLAAIRAAGAASRIIADANDVITEGIIRGYAERQATNERIFDAVSQTIRGIETYDDPFEDRTLLLPNGYTYAYASAEGGVVLTNDPGFDPVRQLPGQTWEPMVVER